MVDLSNGTVTADALSYVSQRMSIVSCVLIHLCVPVALCFFLLDLSLSRCLSVCLVVSRRVSKSFVLRHSRSDVVHMEDKKS